MSLDLDPVHERRRRDIALVVLFHVGPVAWGTQFLAGYVLEEVISCTPASRTPGEILGASIHSVLWGVTLVAALVTLVAAVWTFVLWRRIRVTDVTGRPRWLATVSVMNSVFFILVIVTAAVPLAVVDVCRSAV